jgi:hypothetical protein
MPRHLCFPKTNTVDIALFSRHRGIADAADAKSAHIETTAAVNQALPVS